MTDKRDNVLQVPARALIDKDSKKIVRILVNNVLQEIPVEVGMQGDEGMVEIKSGLKVGDKVITFIKNATTPAK